MWKKAGFYYADWHDAKGIRHRKSFDTAKKAKAFEIQQKATAHPNDQSPRPSQTSRQAGKKSTANPQTSASARN